MHVNRCTAIRDNLSDGVLYDLLKDLFYQKLQLSPEEVFSEIGIVDESLIALNATFVYLKSPKKDLSQVLFLLLTLPLANLLEIKDGLLPCQMVACLQAL